MTKDRLLLSPAALAKQLDDPDLLVIDLSKPNIHAQAHIPGAIPLSPQSLQSGLQPAPGTLPSRESLEALFSQIGLQPGHHVVACDDEGGGWAGRLLWTLEVIGHRGYALLDGGIHAWLAEELPVTTEPAATVPSECHITSLDTAPRVDRDYLLANLHRPDLVLWDSRSAGEYRGERVLAARGGHIPGAVHFEWTQAMDNGRHLQLRDLDTLRQELAAVGITADKEIVVYCQTHHRSGLSWILGQILGFPRIRAYPGSWAEWGNDAETPVATGDAP